MICQWMVKGTTDRIPFELTVLARDEEQARDIAREQMSDWSTGSERFTEVSKTGYVLVHENDLRKGSR